MKPYRDPGCADCDSPETHAIDRHNVARCWRCSNVAVKRSVDRDLGIATILVPLFVGPIVASMRKFNASMAILLGVFLFTGVVIYMVNREPRRRP